MHCDPTASHYLKLVLDQIFSPANFRNEIVWKQIGGHKGIAGNERCDAIATEFADGKKPELYAGVLENYRIRNILNVS